MYEQGAGETKAQRLVSWLGWMTASLALVLCLGTGAIFKVMGLPHRTEWLERRWPNDALRIRLEIRRERPTGPAILAGRFECYNMEGHLLVEGLVRDGKRLGRWRVHNPPKESAYIGAPPACELTFDEQGSYIDGFWLDKDGQRAGPLDERDHKGASKWTEERLEAALKGAPR